MSGSMSAVSSGVFPGVGASFTRLSPRLRFVVLGLSISFAAVPFLFITTFQIGGYRLNDLQGTAFFFSLGLLPGVIGICFHIVAAATRRVKGTDTIQQYYAFRTDRERVRKHERAMVTVDHASSDPLGAISASLFLTGIFLLIAIFAGFEADPKQGIAYNGVQGMMYAGLGAYVAVLYYMVARLYANALSSRFLLTSALRSASAVVIGWVFGIVGVTALVTPSASGQASTGALASNGVLFLIGLFHSSAIDMLRTRAMKLFGRAQHDEDEIALTTIEGIDLTTADLLAEYGVGSVQHLATAEPGELCDRTLLPLDRILDWIDQAMLIRYLRKHIAVSRPMGIRGAINLALVHMRTDGKPDGDEAKLLTSLAEKAGMPFAAMDNIGREMRNEYMVGLIYELQQGRPFPDRGAVSEPAGQPPRPTIPIAQPVTAATPVFSPAGSAG
jgi:MFS family permease